jgi:hypothetical protein
MPGALQAVRFSGFLRCAASVGPLLSALAIRELATAIWRISPTHDVFNVR